MIAAGPAVGRSSCRRHSSAGRSRTSCTPAILRKPWHSRPGTPTRRSRLGRRATGSCPWAPCRPCPWSRTRSCRPSACSSRARGGRRVVVVVEWGEGVGRAAGRMGWARGSGRAARASSAASTRCRPPSRTAGSARRRRRPTRWLRSARCQSARSRARRAGARRGAPSTAR